ncbi:MAG: class II aldolase/adducin family protein [Enterococcaceae bacterium]|jgi:ribulose-5-phosphate 4-epimerase/fuculose-1-phosphate aldolase|nr:class II aldolase/adducin family protein [Enterococcaceae bacterium]MCI1919309.1 class II aldolase/adducin family protein [Enterococcaceae bacterium]
MNILEAKKEVLDVAKKAHQEKLVAGTSGNVSIYLKSKDLVVITPSSIPYASMKDSDISVITLDGKVVDGKHSPSSEWPMHTEIYRKLEKECALVHTHSPYATSFAVCNEGIPEILIEMKPFIGGDIKVVPFAPAGSQELGEITAPFLIDRNACLLANHGTLSVGDNLEKAFFSSIYLEDAAKIYHLAKSVGNPRII